MSLGIREVDALHTRVAVFDVEDAWPSPEDGSPGRLESATFDLVDFLPARHYLVFNPTQVQFGDSGPQLFPVDDPAGARVAFPDPRFVVHYYMNLRSPLEALRRAQAQSEYFELIFLTGAGTEFPDFNSGLGGVTENVAARIPYVGTRAGIECLALGGTGGSQSNGEGQSGQVVITGRYFKAVAIFSPTIIPLPSFCFGVYLSPITG